MITHVIYHIYGRKVGCTRNFHNRKGWYRSEGYTDKDFEILEELHDKTDQEAGDIEWQWLERFGYKKRGQPHYSSLAIEQRRKNANKAREAMIVSRSSDQWSEFASKGGSARMASLTTEQRKSLARKGGIACYEQSTEEERSKRAAGNGHRARNSMTEEEWRRMSVNGGKKRAVELSHLAKKIVCCPHCNLKGGFTAMQRWHFDNCSFKKK
jgi:hypothetical protein